MSTQEQSAQGVSLQNQRTRIEAWCIGNTYELDSVFVEAASGGKASNRPELQKALSQTCKIKGVLVVYSLSRLARSVKDTLAIAERLEKASAHLASLTEQIDSSSAVGKLIFRILSTLNEFERDQLSERTESAMSHLRSAGRRISPRLPFGQNLGPDGVSLVANEAEQRALADIMAWHSAGVTPTETARRLTIAGVKTKCGNSIWIPATVRGIIARSRKVIS